MSDERKWVITILLWTEKDAVFELFQLTTVNWEQDISGLDRAAYQRLHKQTQNISL